MSRVHWDDVAELRQYQPDHRADERVKMRHRKVKSEESNRWIHSG